MPGLKILVVEDDQVQMRQVARILRAEGHIVLQASNGEKALGILVNEKVNLVVTDRKMPGMNGDSLMALIRSAYPGTPVAIVTAYPEGVEELMPDALLEKPFGADQLKEIVRQLT